MQECQVGSQSPQIGASCRTDQHVPETAGEFGDLPVHGLDRVSKGFDSTVYILENRFDVLINRFYDNFDNIIHLEIPTMFVLFDALWILILLVVLIAIVLLLATMMGDEAWVILWVLAFGFAGLKFRDFLQALRSRSMKDASTISRPRF